MSGGGEGKKAIWLITYCDMLTLLLTAFILLSSLAPQVKEKYFPSSIFPGHRPTDVGSKRMTVNRDAVFSRIIPVGGRQTPEGAEHRPLYGKEAPTAERVAAVLRRLELGKTNTLADNHVLQVPFDLLFDQEGQMTLSGKDLIRPIGERLQPLPYDLHVEVDVAGDVPQAVTICQFLGRHMVPEREKRISPDRLAVGVRGGETSREWVWLTFVRQ